MGDEAEIRFQRLDASGVPVGEPLGVRGAVRVTPPDDDEYMAVRATDLVGKEMLHDTLGRAVGRRDGGFVVVDYPDAGPFCRTHIRADTWVRIKRSTS